MSTQYMISVIIPVYNVAPYLRRCVESVLHQTYRQLEIILVDDGSTDESGAICDELAREDERIRVIHKANGGLSDARNAGLAVATGDYVAFLDSDDEWLIPDGIEQMMRRLEKNASDILYYKRLTIYDRKKEFSRNHDVDFYHNHSAKEIFANLVQRQLFGVSACMLLIKRKVLDDNQIRFKVGLLSEDVDFSFRLWQHIQSVDALNIDMYGYHRRTDSITATYSIRNLKSYDWMYTHWKEEIGNRCINYQAIGAHLANLYVGSCYSYSSIVRKDRKQAMEILLRHQDLLSYAASKKSLRMKKIVNFIGIRHGIVLFAAYGKLKKYYKAIIGH